MAATSFLLLVFFLHLIVVVRQPDQVHLLRLDMVTVAMRAVNVWFPDDGVDPELWAASQLGWRLGFELIGVRGAVARGIVSERPMREVKKESPEDGEGFTHNESLKVHVGIPRE